MDNNHKWANAQVKALIEAGVNPLDAQRSATWVLAHVPVGVDLDTWIPATFDMVETLDKTSEADALSVWFSEAEVKGKRLLSAGVE